MKKKASILINVLNAGGAERVVSLLLENLQYNHDITLVLFSRGIEYNLPENQKIITLGQPLHEIGLLTILKLPLLAWRYNRICKKNNIEVSFSFLKRPNYVNCLSRLWGNKARIIISERAFLSEYLKIMSPPKRFIAIHLTRRLYPLAHLIISNSELIKTDLQKNFNIHTNYKVINNPVNLDMISRLSSIDAGIPNDTIFTFISVGLFRQEKNHNLLIDAFSKIVHLPVRLVLLGKGNMEETIKNKVRTMNLETQIIFLGFDSNPFKYLAKSDCFILSSDFEGLPNCILEAMACSIPVISTDCRSGPREILAPDTDPEVNINDHIEVAKYGILVPIRSVQLLAEAMELMVKDKELHERLKQKAKERSIDFESGKIIREFEKAIV